MKKPVTRRDIIRVGSVVFASGAVAVLESLLAACGGAAKSSASTSSSSSSNSSGSSGSCLKATNVTRGPYFVDDRSDANITNDDVDSSIPPRSDIRSDTKGGTGVQSGLPLYLNLTVGDYSSGTCSPISNAQVHIWHCNAQGAYSDIQAPTNDGGTDLTGENFLRGYVWTGLKRFGKLHDDLPRMVQRPCGTHSREGPNVRFIRQCHYGGDDTTVLQRFDDGLGVLGQFRL